MVTDSGRSLVGLGQPSLITPIHGQPDQNPRIASSSHPWPRATKLVQGEGNQATKEIKIVMEDYRKKSQ